MKGTATKTSYADRRFTNGLIRKLNEVTERDESHCVSYTGVAIKSIYFLALMIVGMVGYFILWQGVIAAENDPNSMLGVIAIAGLPIALIFMFLGPFLAFRVRPLVPVLGTLFSIASGYVVGFLIEMLPAEYSYIGWLAAVITIAIVLAMGVLYMSRIIKVDQKFRAVISTLFFSSIIIGIFSFVGLLIPATAPFVKAVMNNMILSLVISVFYIIIASLMLLVDFDTIQSSVEKKLPKKYEWAASFALVYTVINLYLRIFSLLQKAENN